MVDLVAGANIALTGHTWNVSIKFAQDIRHDLGVAVLPVNEATQLLIAPGFAHQPGNAWLSAELSADGCTYQLSLDVSRLPDPAVSRLLLVIYRYSARGAVSVGAHADLQLADVCHYGVDLANMDAAALIVAEIYRRADTWKLRALAETSAYGLAVLGHRLGMELDDSCPFASNLPMQTAETWTGTAFLVAPGVLITNAHVAEGANRMRLTSLQGNVDAEIIISDHNNDLALLRAQLPSTIQPLQFRRTGAGLAEPITTLGYPLASLMGSGIQVTQGVISGLFGMQNDIRLLQFTAPIQPGSSGSPLFDAHGAVIGVVSATFTQSQNMNFAVRGLLATALTEAVNIPCSFQQQSANLPATQLVAQLQ
ncbi:MAG: trypsin-like peptidase domain-containing protein, partial [Methylococcales bacterium]